MPEASTAHSVEVSWDGSDELKLKAMTAHEALGRPFRFDLLLLCEKPDIAFDDAVGKTMTVTYTDREDEVTSYFHGIVSDFVQADEDNESTTAEGQMFGYRATLVPWLWVMSRTQDCRIFQSKTHLDIIKQVCSDRGFTDFVDSTTTTSYPELEFTVQYRESDFNFISRLMEREGIHYYYRHQNNKHEVVLVDDSTAHPDGSVPELPFRGKDASRTEELEPIRDWRLHKRVQPGKYTLNDYNFETPSADLKSVSQVSRTHGHAKGEVYDYPGLYTVNTDGDNLAKVNIERLQARHSIVSGRTVCQSVRAGYYFKLKDHPRSDQNAEYLIIESKITLRPEMFGIAGSAGVGQRKDKVYECEFKAIERNTPFRPERITPRPVVHGPQTAVVTGPSGDEIHTDEYGRVKVQFHWDREGQKDENSSCWIRVSHSWADNKWGSIRIPRIGQEVMVEFLEGDPDRPIITGVVYNAERMPPYKLPDNQTQSGLKTMSTKEGTKDTFNELRFEDKKDEEQIYFHAEKNFDRVVENNDTLKVGFDDQEDGDRKVEIWNNEIYKIGAGQGKNADGSQTVEIWKNRTTTLKEGNDTLKVEKGELMIDVAEKITLKCGKSVLVMKKDGTITVDGKDLKQTMSSGFKVKAMKGDFKTDMDFKLNAGMNVDLKGGLNAAVKGGIAAKLEGGAMAVVKGGIVKIN